MMSCVHVCGFMRRHFVAKTCEILVFCVYWELSLRGLPFEESVGLLPFLTGVPLVTQMTIRVYLLWLFTYE